MAKVIPMPFKTPIINVTGFNSKNSDKIKYADLRNVTKPVLYEPHDKFPIPPLMKEKKNNEAAYISNEGEETDDEVYIIKKYVEI